MKAPKRGIFRENICLEVACALHVAFTFFFFGPLEIFLSSPQEFWFSASDVIGLVSFSTFSCFMAIMGVQYVVSFWGEKALRICSSVFGAVGLGFYIQGNWTFINYGKMDGTPINWTAYSRWAVVNTIIWILILAVTIYFINFKFRFLAIYIMAGIIGMEMLTLGILCVSSVDKKSEVDFALEGGHEFQLSANKNNIIVICADGFDGSDFLPVLREEPNFKQYFDGFTFYEDTCGTSLYSEESGITLLTGNQFEAGLTFTENVNKAYASTDLYKVLKQNNYDTYLYLQKEEMLSPELAGQVINFASTKKEIKQFATIKEIYRMVSFRYLPHIMKKYFWYTSMDFLELKNGKNCLYYNYDVYDLIQNQGVKAEKTDQNIYQFYWIQGPHEPANTDRYCRKVDRVIAMEDETYANSQFEQTIGVVRMYTALICALKEADVYDNTTIIFTADHGWDIRPNPCLLVKPANSHGELIVSDVPVSMIEDYLPTLEYFITGEKDFGDTIYELRSGMERERKLYVYSSRMYESRIESSYKAGAFLKNVKLGKQLLPDDIMAYIESGFSHSEHTHIWTADSEAVLEFNMNDTFSDLRLDLCYGTYNGSQPVKIYANNVLISEFEANGNEEKSIIIPSECVKEGKLRLQFQFTNEISPAEVDPNNKDSRKLALAFYSLTLSDTSE